MKIKKIIAVFLAAAFVLALSACKSDDTSSSQTEKNEYKGINMSVACIKGPTGIGMAKLMEDNENKKTANNYEFTVSNSADEISGKIVTGELNIASVPTNLAAKLYAKSGSNVQILAVNTLGTLSLIENGNDIKSFKDLKGKTVYSIGEGSNPEYILKHLLKENKIDPEKDVTINFVATNDELIALLVSGQAKIAMLPEPAATTVLAKSKDLRRAVSVNDEWEKIGKGELMMGCIVANKNFTEQNKMQINKFLEEYDASIKFAIRSLEETAQLCEKFEIIPNVKIAEAAIPNCNLTFVKGSDIKKNIKDYFNVLYNFDKTSVGGNLPKDDFYYAEK